MSRRTPLLLFLVSFVVFNLNLRPVASCDSIPTALVPFAIVLDHTIALDRYCQPYVDVYPLWPPYFFTFTRGHAYSNYPIATALLITPLYVPVAALLQMRDWPAEQIVAVARAMEKISASLIASLSVTAFYFLLRRFTTYKAALLYAILFAFGTETFSTSSQSLWQHGPGALMIICSLLCLSYMKNLNNKMSLIILAGMLAGLSVAIRPTNSLFLAASYLYLVFSAARREVSWTNRIVDLALYSLFPVLILSALAWYNYYLFGSLRGNADYQSSIETPSLDTLRHMAGLLVSPSRGIFIYIPILLASLAGIVMWICRREKEPSPVYVVSLLFAVFQLFVFSCCRSEFWVGGGCYGPRYLSEITPGLILFLIPVNTVLFRNLLVKGIFALCLLYSISVQAIGAFCYPNGGWEVAPVPFWECPERVWDWKDNPIVRAAKAGIMKDSFRQIYHAHHQETSLITVWENGFAGREGTETFNWRWCAEHGRLSIFNLTEHEKVISLEMSCEAGRPEPARLKMDSPWFSEELAISNCQRGHLARTVTLPPGLSQINFACHAQRLSAPGDPRILVFRVINASLKEIN